MQTDIELQQILESDVVPPHVVAKLENLKPDTCCRHRSWGIGQVKEWNPTLNQIIIDFRDKPGHAMEFGYAADSLTSLADNHVDAKVLVALDEVKEMAKSDVTGLMKMAVGSLGKLATAERIELSLVPEVIEPADWKKFWDGAKRAMKKDPHFEVPSKRSECITLHDQPQDIKATLVSTFNKAKGVKAKALALENIMKVWKEIDDMEFLAEAETTIDTLLKKVPKSQVASAIELSLVREELLDIAGKELNEDSWGIAKFLPSDVKQMTGLMEKLPALKQARVLARARRNMGDQWPELFLDLLPFASGKMGQAIIQAFEDEGRADEVLFTIQRLIRERNLSPDFMIYICKNRNGFFEKLVDTQFILAIISAIEFDQMGGIKKATRLADLILTDKKVLKDLLSKSSDEEVRDITRAILLSPAFEELDKRSLLAAMVKLYPFIQPMIVGDRENSEDEDSSPLIVSWDSLRVRQKELEEIVNHKIPQNSREIAIARSYGDLRENAEFKAAKEMQTILMRRKAELEIMLTQAQGTDFKEVDTTEVNIGTTVTISYLASGQKTAYTVLGAWDSAPEKGIISYMTPVAMALAKHKIGDVVEVPQEEGSEAQKVKIEAIEPYTK
ncbi:MAG: GreA/GreB family elongation factor [Verrucomicrobiota bacterium]